MKICFIKPSIIKKRIPRTWHFQPLAPAVLKAFINKNDIEFNFYDDRVENIDFNKNYDLVMLSVSTLSAKRAYRIAEGFRKKRIKIVMGGFHPTFAAKEALDFCDSIVIGEGELLIQELISDFYKGKLKKIYKGNYLKDLKELKTDRTVFKGKRYLPFSLVEATRGCGFNCEFCSVQKFFGRKHRVRPVKNIIKEIKEIKNKYIVFTDDNLTFNKEFAKTLFKELIPLKKLWFAQVSIDFGFNDELVELAYRSGCRGVLIGFESLSNKNLKIMKKEWMGKYSEIDYVIKKLHKKGINIYASFISGYDFDTKYTIHKILKYSINNAFFLVGFNPLLPTPGTELYNRYSKSKDFNCKWYLDENYRFGFIPFIHKNFDDDLNEFIIKKRKQFYSFPSIFTRFLRIIFERRKNPLLFLILNFSAYREIRQKFGLKIG